MPVLIIDLLSDITHSRIDLILENVMLSKQPIILKCVKRPQLSNPDRIPFVLFSQYWLLVHLPFGLLGKLVTTQHMVRQNWVSKEYP
jgi:hypothetical protein